MATSPLYLITYDYVGRLGRVTGTYDLDLDLHAREKVVRDVALGNVVGVQHIYECMPDATTCTDITAEIATAVADYLSAEREPVSHELKNWLHEMHPAGIRSTLNIADA
jgi:hypothetical protein